MKTGGANDGRGTLRAPILTKRLREVVERSGGVTAFSRKVGISRPTVSFWYNGERTPDAVSIKTIAEKCGVSADWLLGIESSGNMTPSAAAAADDLGLTIGAYESLATLRDYAETLNLFIGSLGFAPFISALDACFYNKTKGDDKKCEEMLFMATWCIRDMILPQVARECKKRKLTTAIQRRQAAQSGEGNKGGEDGKL